jgi:hypothetical protein
MDDRANSSKIAPSANNQEGQLVHPRRNHRRPNALGRDARSNNLPPGWGSKAGLLLVLFVVIMAAAAVYLAWSDTPPDVGTPKGAATFTPVKLAR